MNTTAKENRPKSYKGAVHCLLFEAWPDLMSCVTERPAKLLADFFDYTVRAFLALVFFIFECVLFLALFVYLVLTSLVILFPFIGLIVGGGYIIFQLFKI